MTLDGLERSREFLALFAEVMLGLEIEPEFCRIAEESGEAECRVSGDTTLSVDDFADASLIQFRAFSELVRSEIHRLEKVFEKYLAGMNVRDVLHNILLSVVVHKLNIEGVSIVPAEAYAKLHIYADTVLAGAVVLKCVQPVARRDPQISKAGGRMKMKEALERSPSYICR